MPETNSTKLILLELNEVNFEYVRHYTEHGELPVFARLLAEHGCTTTRSEPVYEHIEPWIQWVSVHTGKSFAEHGVFRLGDAPATGQEQIWETLEKRGLKVGAFSPMNAGNTLRNPVFFVPDPWTVAPVAGPGVLKRLYAAVAQAVNDNAQARITPRSTIDLIAGFYAYADWGKLPSYIADVLRSPRAHWAKALFLDRLLADCFFKLWRQTQPDFSSLFLNGAAHLQHHYLFNSGAYSGSHRNPAWYIPRTADPILEIYRLYDQVLADCLALDPRPRIMIVTGLHQDPVDTPVYYWRLKNHDAFLSKLGRPFSSVQPRMSRDFLVQCADAGDAARLGALLASGSGPDGVALFEVDNRGDSLFVTLAYPHAIEAGFDARFGERVIRNFAADVVFEAIKNAHHNGAGYFLDTGKATSPARQEIPLTDVWQRVMSAF